VPHIDPEHLALLALGEEPAQPDDMGHLADCDRCQEELTSLRRTVDLARADNGDDGWSAGEDGWVAGEEPLPPPPARVWDAIALQLREDREHDPALMRSVSPVAEADRSPRAPADELPARPPEPTPAAEPARAPEPGRVVPFERSRSRLRSGLLVAACLVGVLAGVVVGAVVRWPGESTTPRTKETVVASASLSALAGTPSSAGGRAEVVRVDDRLQLRVDARNLPLREGFYEVWMFDPRSNTMQPMGTLDVGHQTSFPIPNGVDIVKFAGVDVSAEPFDGNPDHSAESVLRGTLSR
jgi:hypothetical protein